MTLKAELAQYLITSSWQKNAKLAKPEKPWPWADTYVAAKLSFNSLNQVRYVMVDASGESLAFGPGFVHNAGQSQTNQGTAIAGHRDSHFEVLQNLQLNDELTLEYPNRSTVRYRVVSHTVIDTRLQGLSEPDPADLVLITCYPFNGLIPGGPLRYVVFAERADLKSGQQTKPEHTT